LNELTLNNHNHGGFEGFGKKIFTVVDETSGAGIASVKLQYVSPDGEEGYPGTLNLSVTFELSSSGELAIHYHAKADKPTHVNLTHHAYFNLDGDPGQSPNPWLCIDARHYLESNERFLPTGEVKDVAQTRFDFSESKQVFSPEIKQYTPAYNTYYFFDGSEDDRQCTLSNDEGETTVTISTSMPGVLLYTGDYLDNPFQKYSGICLECQYPPDAPNHAHFPSTLLRPGEVWENWIRYKIN
jgi:aldose 1-epimerase